MMVKLLQVVKERVVMLIQVMKESGDLPGANDGDGSVV